MKEDDVIVDERGRKWLVVDVRRANLPGELALSGSQELLLTSEVVRVKRLPDGPPTRPVEMPVAIEA